MKLFNFSSFVLLIFPADEFLNMYIQDDPLLDDYNVEEKVNDFIRAAIDQVC